MHPVSHGKHEQLRAPNLLRHSAKVCLSVKSALAIGLLLPRHKSSLKRRHVVYLCSAAHTPGWTAELIGKQIVTLQLGERPSALPLLTAQDLRHGDLGVVVEYPRGPPPKYAKARTWPSRNASVVSAGNAVTKQSSEWGRSIAR